MESGTASGHIRGSNEQAEIRRVPGGSASSLKERVYSLNSGPLEPPNRCGILIYTATAGAQGTLGAWSETASRFAQILRGARVRSAICSNDPVCADHEPDDRTGDRATHGVACHGCLLIAETSCEMRNLFLDRNLLVPTMASDGAAFFSSDDTIVALQARNRPSPRRCRSTRSPATSSAFGGVVRGAARPCLLCVC